MNLPDPEWRERLVESGFIDNTKDTKEGRLTRFLVAIGGVAACVNLEEDAEKIMSRGKMFRGYNARMMRGEPSNCHANSVRLFLNNTKTLELCTGYAMSRDGVWRQHSWCFARKSKIVVETTTRRVLYFGFILNRDEMEHFAFHNG